MRINDPRVRFRITTGRHDGSLPPSISASFTVTDEQFWQLVRAYNHGRNRGLFLEALVQTCLQEEGHELLAETGQEERADNPQDKRQAQEGDFAGRDGNDRVTETGETYDKEREKTIRTSQAAREKERGSRAKLAFGLGVHVLRKGTGTYTAQEAGS